MEMRPLAISMLGADRLTSDAIIVFVQGRPPKRGERAPVVAKVREPQPGSYDLLGGLQDTAWALQIGLPIAQQVLATHISHWWTAAKALSVGKRDIAEVAMQHMVDMNRDHLAARDASDQRMHDERMRYLDTLRLVLPTQQKSIEQFAEPIGRTVSNGTLRPSTAPAVRIDSDEAAAIRDAGQLVWSDLAEIELETDGFRFHTSGLSVKNPEREGYLMAKVSDPRFEQEENLYSAAAHRRARIAVLARLGYRSRELVALDIVDFRREVPTV